MDSTKAIAGLREHAALSRRHGATDVAIGLEAADSIEFARHAYPTLVKLVRYFDIHNDTVWMFNVEALLDTPIMRAIAEENKNA